MRWLLLLVLFFTQAAAWAGKAPNAADLAQLKNHIKQAQLRVRQSIGQQNQLQKNLAESEIQLGKLNVTIDKLNQSIENKQQSLIQLNQQKQQLSQLQSKQAALLAKQIQVSYRLGRESQIKLLLNQQDPSKISRSQVYVDYFNQARIDALNQYQDTLTDISDNQRLIEQQSQQLQSDKQQQQQQQRALAESQQKRKQSIQQLANSIHSDQEKIKQWQQEQKQLQLLLDEIEQAVSTIRLPSDAKPFKQMKHQLIWPVKGHLSNRFGEIRPPGHLRFEGIRISAKLGSNVYAIAHGRVVFADWFRGKGLLLIIDHGDGYMSLYAHNQSLLFETGDWVSSGQIIAKVGNSGGLSQSALYFEIRYQGKPINPTHWLKKQ